MKLFENVLRNQLGLTNWDDRMETIRGYHNAFPDKCPRCGNEKIGMTYTTGTGYCSKCNSSLLLTQAGIVALTRKKDEQERMINCHFWFQNGNERECGECVDGGPVFCGKINHVCL